MKSANTIQLNQSQLSSIAKINKAALRHFLKKWMEKKIYRKENKLSKLEI